MFFKRGYPTQTVIAMDEGLRLTPSRLDYFKSGCQFDKRVKEKRKQIVAAAGESGGAGGRRRRGARAADSERRALPAGCGAGRGRGREGAARPGGAEPGLSVRGGAPRDPPGRRGAVDLGHAHASGLGALESAGAQIHPTGVRATSALTAAFSAASVTPCVDESRRHVEGGAGASAGHSYRVRMWTARPRGTAGAAAIEPLAPHLGRAEARGELPPRGRGRGERGGPRARR